MLQLIDSSGVGGAERHAATLSRGLIDRGLTAKVLLYADHGANAWLDQLAALGVPVRVLDNTVAGLWRALAEEQPQLLHTHGYKGGILGRIAGTLQRIPVVSTFHSGERGVYPVFAYDLADEWTSFLSFNIAVSTAIAKRLPSRSVVIPSFVTAGECPPPDPLPRRIGYVGRFSAEKRPDLFCAIASRVGRTAEWHMYGDGPLRRELEERYGEIVHFHGVETDMSRVWPHLGALLMPSDSEGLPLAALEALSAGVPVVASAVGGLPDVVIDAATGWLFPAGDVEAAAARVGMLLSLDQEQQRCMRQACWQHVVAHYSQSALLPAVLDVYRRAGLAIS